VTVLEGKRPRRRYLPLPPPGSPGMDVRRRIGVIRCGANARKGVRLLASPFTVFFLLNLTCDCYPVAVTVTDRSLALHLRDVAPDVATTISRFPVIDFTMIRYVDLS